jgi:hypothetical protein
VGDHGSYERTSGPRARRDVRFSHVSSIDNVSPSDSTTARSTTFCSSMYIQASSAGEMNDIIESDDEGQFANRQKGRDLRVNSDATEPETQSDSVNVIEECPDVAPEQFPAPVVKVVA